MIVSVVLSLRDYDSFQLGTYSDDAYYVVLAQSISRSGQYGLIHNPGDQPDPAPYPFGYPLLLAPFDLLFPGNLDAMKALSLIATLSNGALLFWGWRWLSRRSHWWAVAVAGLYMLARLTIEHARMAESEALFTTFCLAAAILAAIAAQKVWSPWRSLLIGVMLVCAVSIRTVGVVLVATVLGVLLYGLKDRFWRELLWIVAAVVLVAGLIVSIAPVQLADLVPARYFAGGDARFLIALGLPFVSADGIDQLPSRYVTEDDAGTARGRVDVAGLSADFLRKARRHLLKDLRQAVLPIGGGAREQAFGEWIGVPLLPDLVGALTLVLIVLGFVTWFAHDGVSAFSLFAILHFGALLLWNWKGPRLLYPIQPQLLLAFLLGLEAAVSWVSSLMPGGFAPRFRRVVLTCCILVLVLLSGYQSFSIPDSRLHAGDLKARTQWIRDNTAPSDILLSEEPVVDFLYGDRKTVRQPESLSSADELGSFLEENAIDFILIAAEIDWQASYVPTYSDETIELLPLIAELASQDVITQVYPTDRDLVQVFQTRVE
jgi:hypothetical protein